MSVAEHIYGVPSDDELAQLVGAATPHFALQIRERVAALADFLPDGDPRQATLRAHMAHLERLAFDGEPGATGTVDLQPRPPLRGITAA